MGRRRRCPRTGEERPTAADRIATGGTAAAGIILFVIIKLIKLFENGTLGRAKIPIAENQIQYRFTLLRFLENRDYNSFSCGLFRFPYPVREQLFDQKSRCDPKTTRFFCFVTF